MNSKKVLGCLFHIVNRDWFMLREEGREEVVRVVFLRMLSPAKIQNLKS